MRGDPEMAPGPRSAEPLPRSAIRCLGSALAMALAAAAALAVGTPAIRQSRLIAEATRATRARTAEARQWLERGPAIVAALEQERAASLERIPFLLLPDDEAGVRESLLRIALDRGFDVEAFEIGTVRSGEAFDTVPARLRVRGDRAELPPLMATFLARQRVVRLVALDLESPEFGSERVVATLRWEYAAPSQRRPPPPDPGLRWAPPRLAGESDRRLAVWNRGRWRDLQAATGEIRSLGPDLRGLAAIEQERAALEQERRALQRWREAAESERGAVERKLPVLLHRLETSAVGRAGLRPGPGGTLLIVDDD